MKGKLRNIKKFLISLLMITTIVVMGATVYAAPQKIEMKASGSGPIWFDDGTVGNWYCREKGKPAVFYNEAGEVIETTEYELETSDMKMEPMTGYAYYKLSKDGDDCGTSTKQDMQRIIWSSKYISEYFGFGTPTVVEDDSYSNWWFENSSTVLVDEDDKNSDGIPDLEQWDEVLEWVERMSGLKTREEQEGWYQEYTSNEGKPSVLFIRSQQYGRVHYGIFKRLIDGVMFVPGECDDLKVMVDQISGTYTVGPYTMNLNVSDEYNGKEEFEKAKQILYNELIGEGNEGFTKANRFANEVEITGLNNKEGTDIVMLNSLGEEIKFPNFKAYDGSTNETEEFYLRFVPDNDGQIDYTGDPEIHIKYLLDFADCIVQRYKLEKVSDQIAVGEGTDLKALVYKVFEDWYKGFVTKTVVIDGNGKYHYRYYVAGDLEFTDIKVKIKNSRIEIEVKVDDFSQSFDSGNNVHDTEQKTASYISISDPNDSNYPGYYDYPSTAPDVTSDILEDLKTQCEAVLDKIEIDYEYEDQGGDLADNVQRCSLIGQGKYNDGFHLVEVEANWKECIVKLPGKEINEKLGGHVWYEGNGIKTGEADGKYNSAEDMLYAGMQVTLWEQNLDGSNDHIFEYEGVANPTVTDEKGEYKFEHLNPLKKYYVKFLYNGEYYQSTYYKYNLTGNYSNAMDVEREAFNNRFTVIEANPEAYNVDGYNTAYAKESRLMKADGSFIAGDYEPTYSTNYESQDYKGALLYIDAWEYFRDKAVETKSYDGAYAALGAWLSGLGVDGTEVSRIIKFMKDCMITSTTKVVDPLGNYECEGQEKVVYPVYNRFVLEDEENPPENIETVILDETFYYLYTKKSDQSRWVDYGIDARIDTNLVISKDVYKATVFLNGQKEEYYYGQQGVLDPANGGVWKVKVRASDAMFNGVNAYRKYLKPADILMDANATYYGLFGDNQANKNIDVLVTYVIYVANTGSTVASVDEIVDYFDTEKYEFDGKLNGNKYEATVYTNYKETSTGKDVENHYINSYQNTGIATSENKDMKTDLTITNTSTYQHKNHEPIVGDNYKYDPIYVKMPDNVMKPTEYKCFYITFKAKGDKGVDLLDQDITTGDEHVGKRNIAEINGYTTKYVDNQQIPDHLDNSDATITKNVGNTNAGIVDVNSRAGSLANWDLTPDGLIKDADKPLPDSSTTNRLEDDTCAAPPFKLLIDTDPNHVRRVKGFTFEDARTENENKAKVGNGVYKDSDKDVKVNGVTVQLVELVREVDDLNQFTGKYLGEYIWGYVKYKADGSLDGNPVWYDYYSGLDYSRVVIDGPEGTLLHVNPEGLNANQGEYGYSSMPAGDFFIRFIYGDNDRTVLTNASDDTKVQFGTAKGEVKDIELKELQKAVNDLVGSSGMNAKSYNGQDYKSTVYQTGISQDKVKLYGQAIDAYHGITRYTDIDGKNYINSYDKPEENRVNGFTSKESYTVANIWKLSGPSSTLNTNSMYMYNLEDANVRDASDAKDVYAFRQRANQYSIDVQNYKAEVLSSFERVGTYDTLDDNATPNADLQRKMIEELKDNTYMVAQSGVMDLEIEPDKIELRGQQATSGPQSSDPNTPVYLVDDVDLGLVERPEAGLKIKKEVARFQVVLANGETLFDTDKSVNNVFFAKHVGHITGYESFRMKKPQIGDNTKNTPRVIQVYMDDEIMTGSKVSITYKYTVTNVGEVDYTSKTFYYTGKKAGSDEIVKTNATKVADYLSNYLKYQSTYQENPTDWVVTGVDKLIPSTSESGTDDGKIGEDLLNRTYYKDAITYNTILTTDKLGKELLPEVEDKNNSTTSINLMAGTTISGNGTVDGLLYNNLGEIVSVRNTVGRRMQYSRVGNQPIANQNYGDDTDKKYNTAFDLVTPTEIDADSAQLVRILPPTGENRQYAPIIIAAVGVVMILGIAIVVIRKKVLNSNAK